MIQPGHKLAHYEIVSALGKGGMGEVWRARDGKLGREVAIKVLPDEFAHDAERVARMEREARMLAALNHPNIAAIHGLEEAGGNRFLVLELVEGATLADRLLSGAMGIEDALKLALQIAEALEAAHEKNVIHRDLKPANIKVTPEGRVKVLDFGLAKAFIGDHADVNLSNSPTLSIAATQAGIILGTAAYMSPEQASGDVADHRSDVWAFGVVLFEMLSGRQLFTGKTASHVMGAVLERPPDWTLLPANLPPRIRFLLERCLEKEAKDRCPGISEARSEIQKALAEPVVSPSPAPASAVPSSAGPKSQPLVRIGALVAVAVIAALGTWFATSGSAPAPDRIVTRFTQGILDQGGLRNPGRDVVAISPDGRRFVYNTPDGLYLRNLGENEPRLIPGTENPMTNPFFSPDGEWVGYWDALSGQLRTIPIGGGSSITVATIENPGGASWGSDDMILFGQPEGIMQVSKDGGEPELVIAAQAEGEDLWDPQLLPDGRILFTIWRSVTDATIAVARPGSEDRVELFEGERAVYLPTGHLIVTNAAASPNALMARPFDLATLDYGGAVPVVEGVALINFKTHFAVSEGGLVHVTGTGGATGTDKQLAWVDRDGNATPIALAAANYTNVRISPDGSQVVMAIGAQGERDLWLWNVGAVNRQRLTFGAGDEANPVWSADGERIFFVANPDGVSGLYSVPADGGEISTVVEGPLDFIPLPWSVSPDGERLLVVGLYTPEGHTGIVAVDLVDDVGAIEVLLFDESGYVYNEPVVSPDGAWIAYFEGELAAPQIGVRPFPDVQRTQIQMPADFGMGPRWSDDGSELFYMTPQGVFVSRAETAPFRLGTPSLLFSGQYFLGNIAANGVGGRAWDFDAANDRFLMLAVPGSTGDSSVPEINVIVHWPDELAERVPVD